MEFLQYAESIVSSSTITDLEIWLPRRWTERKKHVPAETIRKSLGMPRQRARQSREKKNTVQLECTRRIAQV